MGGAGQPLHPMTRGTWGCFDVTATTTFAVCVTPGSRVVSYKKKIPKKIVMKLPSKA